MQCKNMIGKLQNISFSAFYLVSFQLLSTNSRTSTLWKLNSDETKIVEANPFHQIVSLPNSHYIIEDDPIFNIIASTVCYGQSWIKQDEEYFCTNCRTIQPKTLHKNNSRDSSISLKQSLSKPNDVTYSDEPLDCGTPVNFTPYDNLLGVSNRNRHPNVPEPQISLIFDIKNKKGAKGNSKTLESEVDALERRLKRDKKMKPKSVKLYNQIGNFWRIKGDAQKAIECFRRALAVTPRDANVLLNLARVLFTLQYLDDAIFLIKMSLDAQTCAKETWQQHFTLGEIFKAYGHYDEASLHLKRTLELHPSFKPAQVALKEIEGMPATRLHVYTLIIIISLVLGVLLVILSSVDSSIEADNCDIKPQRHFNRAMAMSTLRGFRIPPKNNRFRKLSA